MEPLFLILNHPCKCFNMACYFSTCFDFVFLFMPQKYVMQCAGVIDMGRLIVQYVGRMSHVMPPFIFILCRFGKRGVIGTIPYENEKLSVDLF